MPETELVLFLDPYKFKKKLAPSDVDGRRSRLLITRNSAKNHLLQLMSWETETEVISGEGADVIVWDDDTNSEHRLVFICWQSSETYVLRGGWIREFVRRRGLEAGDEVGIYWDTLASKSPAYRHFIFASNLIVEFCNAGCITGCAQCVPFLKINGLQNLLLT
ncbi:putative B3 domain-containing protein At1g78640 [Rhodamnia argentea]|uniref:B3 domain-containing protein At1g78640 n=1 Tax=Rhodamnia argentea TaxID=178133 RepID=A0ABM3H4P7_9MYRT|nr:putative B3 domain-containing protein At1g78640 [Rhodamnia argentea]